MTAWRVYYGDGTTFSSEDGGPADAPGGNVTAIVQVDESCGYICRSGDFYLYDLAKYGGWVGVDYWGLAQELIEPGAKVIKLGRTVDNDTYRAVLERASQDIAAKSAWLPDERRPDDG